MLSTNHLISSSLLINLVIQGGLVLFSKSSHLIVYVIPISSPWFLEFNPHMFDVNSGMPYLVWIILLDQSENLDLVVREKFYSR